MQAGFIMSLVFAILVAFFALKNSASVSVDFLFAEIEVSQAIVIFVSAALGAIIVTILGLVRQVKLSLKIKEQAKMITNLENEKNVLECKINDLVNETSVISKNSEKSIDESKEENREYNKSNSIETENNEENMVK